jgi:uncharacterized protein YjbI with pentapeptide repeats
LLRKATLDRLNTGTPTELTIKFVDGLLELLLRAEDDSSDIYISQSKISLLKSFGHSGGLAEAIEQIKDTASKSLAQENIILFNEERAKGTEEREKMWREIPISYGDYLHLWMYRWISLHVLNKLSLTREQKDKLIDKDKLRDLIYCSGNLIPFYLKDFSKNDLSDANLHGVDFSHANLSHANLSQTNLERANLNFTELSGANLAGANLVHARLVDTILNGANLSPPPLSIAMHYAPSWDERSQSIEGFEDMNLVASVISSGSNLSHAVLVSTNLAGANLAYADLSHGKSIKVNLSDAILSHANLSSSIILGPENYTDVDCYKANFNNALTDDERFVNYISDKQSIGVPEVFASENDLRRKLAELGFNESSIETLANQSYFKREGQRESSQYKGEEWAQKRRSPF